METNMDELLSEEGYTDYDTETVTLVEEKPQKDFWQTSYFGVRVNDWIWVGPILFGLCKLCVWLYKKLVKLILTPLDMIIDIVKNSNYD